MAKKQNDYLASLLSGDDDMPLPVRGQAVAPAASVDKQPSGEPAPPPTATAPQEAAPPARSTARAGLSLLGRESALARVASGEVRQVTQLLIDPARVRVWSGNARIQHVLNEDNCRDLIDSIRAEGGQKVPAIVRHLSGDPDHDYELIAGTRRHFAISWLRANHYPDTKLLAQVAELDDEAAFRLADIENRARKDIGDIERARNYALALQDHYGGKAVRMAERLNVSKGWLSKMLKAATVPDRILAAFPQITDLALNPAYKLATTLDDKSRAKVIAKEADAIASENQKALNKGQAPLPASAVLARLMAATATPEEENASLALRIDGPLGRPIVQVKGVNRHGITLHLPLASGASDEELADALSQIIAQLRDKGVTVR